MEKIKGFIKREPVLSAAFVLTIISMCFVPADMEYLSYIDYRVIALLFCLMAVVEGFKNAGVFAGISYMVLSRTKDLRKIAIMLTLLCFFSSMLVTNDVALITFVPLTFFILGGNEDVREVIFLIVMETIAANLGSMATPVGNPQNLYIYSYYNMEPAVFFKTILPYSILSFLLILILMSLRMKKKETYIGVEPVRNMPYGRIIRYLSLFILCLLTVFKILDYRICFAAVLAVMLVFDRGLLKNIDYMLLLTFVCFFIFVGNLGRIDLIREFVSKVIDGKTMLVGVMLSQIISNVPAALMLSGFTNDARELMVGVDIGGLGTLVASLASLISYKFFAQKYPGHIGRYIKIFTFYNAGFLIILVATAIFLL